MFNNYKLKGKFIPWVVTAVAIVLGACAAQPPVQEMSDARQAVAAAQEAGAEEFYPDLLEEANLRLEQAEDNVRLGIYWAAKRDADLAKDYAIDALLSSRRVREELAEREADQKTPE